MTVGPFRGGARGWNLRVINLGRVQRALLQTIEAFAAEHGLARATRFIGADMLEYAANITHKWTGTLAASHRLQFTTGLGQVRGTLHVDPGAVNPITGKRAEMYAFYEHRRGGSHAFYERTFAEFNRDRGLRYMSYMLAEAP